MTKLTEIDTGIERDPPRTLSSVGKGRRTVLPFRHVRVVEAGLQDSTDSHDNLVREREWLLHPKETLELFGNAFAAEDIPSGEGRLFVLAAPLPHVRGAEVPDVRVGWSEADRYVVELSEPGYGADWEILRYEGGEAGRIERLHRWQRERRPERAVHREQRMLSNTWGDRSLDGRMNEAFLLDEIRLAAEMGVEVVQLDDGWQKGVTVNGVDGREGHGSWSDFRAADPEFWTVHPERFPNGLKPLVDLAVSLGVELGLWFAPDSANDFSSWREDADCLLGFFREYGIRFFKLDSIHMVSEAGYLNVRRFLSALREESGGEIVCDLDITAGARPGYFGAMESGVLFVENRYTDWMTYWPHHTLRNLWRLTRWVDPLRLRMEVLNPDRNRETYVDDPLAPSAYEPDALVAMVLGGQPLGWFELSGLSSEFREKARKLLEAWKPLREAYFEGTVLPLGETPEGMGCSGFLSVNSEENRHVLLLYKGMAADTRYRLRLPVRLGEGLRWRCVAGSAGVSAEGEWLDVEMTEPLGYAIGTLMR